MCHWKQVNKSHCSPLQSNADKGIAVIPEKIYFIREDTRQRSRIALIVILQSMVSIAAICSLTGP